MKGERPANVVLLSTFRLDFVADRFEPGKPTFVCPDGPGARAGASTHLPVLDRRSPSLLYINWYDEGLHVLDISNPFAPVFVAHFLSPVFPPPVGGRDRRPVACTRSVTRARSFRTRTPTCCT